MTVIGGEAVILYGLDGSGNPVPLKLNTDGTLSGGSSLTTDELAAIQGANVPTGANPFATIADVGGGSGAIKHVAFPFTHNTAGLVAGTTVAYTPAIGEFLLSAFVEVTELWDGTTPTMDIGLFTAGKAGFGAFNDFPPRKLVSIGSGAILTDAGDGLLASFLLLAAGDALRFELGKFYTTDPVCVCVSQNGSPGGPDPVNNTGEAILHLLILIP